MSGTTLVCTTHGMAAPLVPGGERLYGRQAQIRLVVQRRLGAAHAHLLAEAQLRAGDDGIVWLSAATGLVRKLSALPAPVRDSVRAECDALLADIERLGAALEEAGAGDGRIAGQLLRLAARRASDDHLFLVGNQPVLVCWGCAPADDAVPRAPANPGARWLIPVLQPVPENCVPARAPAVS